MSPSIAEANETLRNAVEARREAQAAGKPHEAWYVSPSETDSFQPVTKPLPERHEAEVSYQQDIHEHHLHRAGLTQDELDEAIERLRGDGLRQTDVHQTSQAFFDLCDGLKEMHRKKSRDYGCPSGTDPLANIRNGAKFVGIPAWRAAMVRLSDKVTRLATFNATGHLHNEGVIDTLEDLASYSLLALLLYREENDG
jgi:hypothetical protein